MEGSKQSILKEISPEYLLEGLMLKLKFQLEFQIPIWPPDGKNWLTGKDPDAGKNWGQEEKGMTEDEMVGWHHWLGPEFEQAPGVGDGQGSLACCSPWGCKESDTTERLNWLNGRLGVADYPAWTWTCCLFPECTLTYMKNGSGEWWMTNNLDVMGKSKGLPLWSLLVGRVGIRWWSWLTI